MKRNVGNVDRIFRVVGALALSTCAVLAPMPLAVAGIFGALGCYLFLSALAGSCLGYRLMGRSTCPVEAAQ
ncbi:MAG: DUF2892 domain-containing protein [Deltaproteobacteria bacterium]|nr:DUF2892 domain-containing protein [Deltaproteobacteria bacterium]